MTDTTTIRVEAVLNFPLHDDDSSLPVRQGIHAYPTATPGLVVHPLITTPTDTSPDWWNVTHIQTGKRIPGIFRSRENATAYAEAAAELADWQDRPAPERDACMALATQHGGIDNADYLDAVRPEPLPAAA